MTRDVQPFRLRRALWLVVAATFLPRATHSQTLAPGFWAPNGTVSSVALSGNTLYVGGEFTQLAPPCGGGVTIDASTGAPRAFPKVAGIVYAAESDGAGGWYIGGGFTHVGGVPRANLAHVLADGSVSKWSPGANGYVNAIAVSGATVFVGGYFTSLGGQPRNLIGAVDATTGQPTTWNPDANGFVNTIAVDGSNVYLGGRYTSIGGAQRNCLAAVSATTGLATSWDPNPTHPGEEQIFDLQVAGGRLYAAGIFDTIAGQPRAYAAAFDATSGLLTAWAPAFNSAVYALAVSGGTVYVGGPFTDIGGVTRFHIAAIDASSGGAITWSPGANGSVSALRVSGGIVYAAGSFGSIGGEAHNLVAAIDAATGLSTSWDPALAGPAYAGATALAVGGGAVYAGGNFSSMGTVAARRNIAAIDVTTGQPTAWNPFANGPANAILVAGDTVYVGGSFSSIGGQFRMNLAALDAATGLATGWDPNVGDEVLALARSGNTVYAGGRFTSVGILQRNYIAAIDVGTGVATAWDPNAAGTSGGDVHAIALGGGGTVYAGGAFTTIGGQTRHYIAAIDSTSGLATGWNPDAVFPVLALFSSGDLVYAGGDFYIIGGQFRGRIAALDAGTGLATSWSPNVGDSQYPSVLAIAVSGDEVYVGGAFGSAGTKQRNQVAAINATTGIATTWNPDADQGVFALAVGGGRAYVGGQFSTIAGQPCGGLAALQDSPTPVLLERFEAEAAGGGVRIRWRFGEPDRVVAVTLERAEAPSGPWTTLHTDGPGADVDLLDEAASPAVTHYYRLTAELRDGTRARFGPIRVEAVRLTEGLERIAPNPVTRSARIDYAVARAEHVRLTIVDVAGRQVESLRDETAAPGEYSSIWEPRRARVPAGVYFVRWESPGRTMQRSLVLTR